MTNLSLLSNVALLLHLIVETEDDTPLHEALLCALFVFNRRAHPVPA